MTEHRRRTVKALRTYVTVCALTSLCVGTGCGRSAFLYRDDHVIAGGRIEEATPETLTLLQRHGSRREVKRALITSIDHPGNGTATLGALMAAWGGLGLFRPSAVGFEGEQAMFSGIATLPALVAGIGLAIYGGAVWGTSFANSLPSH